MGRMLFAITVLACVGYPLWTVAAPLDACLNLFPGGAVPKAISVGVIDLCKTADDQPIFAVRYDTAHKIPIWTAHKLTVAQKNTIDDDPAYANRKDFFAPDSDVPEDEQAQEKNYKNTNFNKGHLVRALDLNWNPKAYRTTFVMTNMAPQRGQLNSGPWLGMEKAFQKFVKSKNATLWAISGVYGQHGNMLTLKNKPENAQVPKCFYKIIVAQTIADDGARTYKTLSALFVNYAEPTGNDRKQKTWKNYITTLDLIKQRSGIDFLEGLDLKSGFDAAYWGAQMPASPADCT